MFGNLIEVLVCAILKPFIYHLYKFFTLDISDGNDINFQNKGSIPPPHLILFENITIFIVKTFFHHDCKTKKMLTSCLQVLVSVV